MRRLAWVLPVVLFGCGQVADDQPPADDAAVVRETGDASAEVVTDDAITPDTTPFVDAGVDVELDAGPLEPGMLVRGPSLLLGVTPEDDAILVVKGVVYAAPLDGGLWVTLPGATAASVSGHVVFGGIPGGELWTWSRASGPHAVGVLTDALLVYDAIATADGLRILWHERSGGMDDYYTAGVDGASRLRPLREPADSTGKCRDGRPMVSGSYVLLNRCDEKGALRLEVFDLVKGAMTTLGSEGSYHVAIDPKGIWFAETISLEKDLVLWRVDGLARYVLAHDDVGVAPPVFLPDGSGVVTSIANEVTVFDTATRTRRSLHVEGSIHEGDVSPDASWLAVVGLDKGTSDVLAVRTDGSLIGPPFLTSLLPTGHTRRAESFTADGKWLLRTKFASGLDNGLHAVDLATLADRKLVGVTGSVIRAAYGSLLLIEYAPGVDTPGLSLAVADVAGTAPQKHLGRTGEVGAGFPDGPELYFFDHDRHRVVFRDILLDAVVVRDLVP